MLSNNVDRDFSPIEIMCSLISLEEKVKNLLLQLVAFLISSAHTYYFRDA